MEETAKTAESCSKKKEEVFRRIQDRRDARQQQSDQPTTASTANENYSQEIDAMISSLKAHLSEVGSDDGELDRSNFLAVTETLDGLNKELQVLERYFKESTAAGMPRYDVEKTQKAVSEVRADYLRLQDELQPKKKFGFKNRAKAKPVSSSVPPASCLITQEPAVAAKAQIDASSSSYRVSNPDNLAVIEVPSADVLERDVSVDNMTACTVKLLGVPSTVHVTNLRDVTLLCGPVQTSVFIENCSDCTFVLACQQLRTHSTTGSNFYLKVTSKGIVEDCRELMFAPYALDYPELLEHMEASGLSADVNNWDKIDDFNWLHTGKQSPNWSVLPPQDRKTFSA